MARAILTTLAREAAYKIMMMRGTLFFIACTTATFAFVPHLKFPQKIRLLAADGGDAPAVEEPKAKAVEAEAPKVAPSPAEDPFDQPKAEAKAAPAAAADAPPKKAPAKPVADAKPDAVAKPPATPAAKVDEATADAAAADTPKPVPKKAPPKKAEAGDAPAPAMKADDGEKPTPVPKKAPVVPKKAPIKAKEGGDAPAAMKPPASGEDAPAKKAIPKKAPPPKKEEKHPYYAWANSPEAGYNTKAPAAYYKEKSQYDLGWFGKYDDSKTEAERSARFLARHDGVGGESYQTRTKERVYKEIAALKEERQARARRARERRGW